MKQISSSLKSALGGLWLVLLLGLISVYPLGRFLLLPFFPSLDPTAGASLAGASETLPLETVLNTLRTGIGAGVAVLPAGLILGFLLERRSWAGNRAIALLVWLILLIPSYLMTSGWQILLASPYLQNSLLHRLFYSEAGLILLLAVKGLPFACFSARATWGAIGNEIGDAARIHVVGAWRRSLIPLRLLLPACASVFAVVFIEAIQDFGVAATMAPHIHLPLVIYTIYTRLALTPVRFEAAAGLTWYLLIMASAAVMLHFYIGTKMSAALVHGRQRHLRPPPCSWSEAVLGCGAILVLGGIGIGVPGLTLIVQSASPVQHTLKPEDWDSVANSALFGFLAATGALLLAVALAARARRGGLLSRGMDLLTLGNMAIPSLLLGAAYVVAFNGAWLPLYGTPLLLVMAYVAGQVPMLTRFLQAPIGQLHSNLGDAARLHGLSWARRIGNVHAPLLLRPLNWGWTIAFGHVFFELPLSELLSPVGRPTLATRLLNLNASLFYEAEAKLAIAGAAVCLIVVGLASVMLHERDSSRRGKMEVRS